MNNETQIIIGLVGKAGSGKSTVAQYLSNAHAFSRRPMAFRLKAMIAALGVPDHILYGNVEEKETPLMELNGHTARHAMQTIGTEWGRDIMGKSFWLDLWMRDVTYLPRIVADDIRFHNEYDAIKKIGGKIIRINRDASGLTGVGAEHSSEKFASEFEVDFTVNNNSNLSVLYTELDRICATIQN